MYQLKNYKFAYELTPNQSLSIKSYLVNHLNLTDDVDKILRECYTREYIHWV